MQLIITREDVLKALKKEPLEPGDFYRVADEGCTVCAVGAVLRHAGVPDNQVQTKGYDITANGEITPGYGASAEQEIAAGRYLNALSIKFETYNGRTKRMGISRLRERMTAWVMRNLPDGVLYTGTV